MALDSMYMCQKGNGAFGLEATSCSQPYKDEATPNKDLWSTYHNGGIVGY